MIANGYVCPACLGPLEEMGSIPEYGLGEYKCVNKCEYYSNKETYLSTKELVELEDELCILESNKK